MIRLIVGICLVLILLNPVWALDDPEAEIARVVRSYVVSKYPNWADLDIRITFKYADKTFKSLKKLSDDTEFRVAEAYQEVNSVGSVIIPIEYEVNEDTKKIFVRAKVEVFRKIVAAAKLIKRGRIIGEEDLKLEKRDIATIPQSYYDMLSQVLFTETKTSIPQNSTIFSWMVKEIPLFHRTEEVTINVISDNLRVKTTGIALEDGYQGQWIRVKVKETGEALDGIVVATGVVEVILK